MKLVKIFSLVAFLAPAYGAVLGPLSITGSVNVTKSSIDWLGPFSLLLPLGGTFNGTQGTFGDATDLFIPGVAPPIANFLSGFTSPALAGVHFDLATFNPTSAPACTGSEALNEICLLPSNVPGGVGPFSASFVNLVGGGTGVAIATQVFGYFNDTGNTFGNGIGTPYNGIYSTQISGVTISQILNTLNNNGSGLPLGAGVPNSTIQATYSANFSEFLEVNPNSPVPEPATYAMLGIGLISVYAFRRKAR